MGLLANSNAIESGGYNIDRSLRFRSSASAYLSRTPASASNRTTWTWNGWVKLGANTNHWTLFNSDSNSSLDRFDFMIQSNNTLYVFERGSSTTQIELATNALYRDYAGWYMITLAVDTTQSTASNRIKLYVNGSQVTSFSTATYPTQNYNTAVDNTKVHNIGRRGIAGSGDAYFDGYLAEVNFIDGQALTPSSFGQTDPVTGVWQPLKYMGTYGTNGFYLPFSDNTSATTLAYDKSGNGNNWTPNNISTTAGDTYDSMTDVPTPYADGGNGRGNYATWNAVTKSPNLSLTSGNLNTTYSSTSNESVGATIGVTSGKWYWESTATNVVSSFPMLGIAKANEAGLRSISGYYPGYSANSWGLYCNTGGFVNNASVLATYSTVATNDVLMFALDMDSGKYWMGKNGTWFNSGAPASGTGSILSSGLTGETIFPMVAEYSGSSSVANFGQRPFSYTPPTGFKALNTFNLPDPTIKKPNQYMDATLYSGTSASQSVTNAGSFQPDFVWVKGRSGATDHALYDAVRGVQKQLESNTTTAETTETTGLTAFNSNGFSVGALAQMNTNAATYVGWQWQAGKGTTSSNTSGSITSTVSVNATAGFSVVTWAATGANATIGHGLGVAPYMIIMKNRDAATNWAVYHQYVGSTNYVLLNSTAASTASSTYWQNTPATSTVFYTGTANDVAYNNMVAYCWAEIAGFSKFGSYTGNGSADGPFVYCGFRPKWLLIKNAGQANSWFLMDTARGTYNVIGPYLYPDTSAAETSYNWVDIVSNGFKIRDTGTGNNNNGVTQIYAAFAENPFKYSLAR